MKCLVKPSSQSIPMNEEEARAWLSLACATGFSPSSARSLLAQIGLPQDIMNASEATLARHIGPAQARLLLTQDEASTERVNAALAWLSAADEGSARSLVTLADADYPKLLLEIADPPVLLYARGRRELLGSDCVAMVGSRNTTPQGEQNAEAFAKALVQAGITVVSGLALGIDAASHRGALAATHAQASTIAVIGTGIDRLYPARNKELAQAISERGLILSEYALGTPPLQGNFPRRNRLISGLSRGVLVVEAAVQSGSLITARLAAEQGREVLAIPGSIHSPMSRGCHALIKQGAKLVESAQDVIEELHLTPSTTSHILLPRLPENELNTSASTNISVGVSQENPLLEALGFDAMELDEISRRTGFSAAALSAQLLELELLGQVARLPGGRFQRIMRA
jgi:DNA processing protein